MRTWSLKIQSPATWPNCICKTHYGNLKGGFVAVTGHFQPKTENPILLCKKSHYGPQYQNESITYQMENRVRTKVSHPQDDNVLY